MRLLKLTLLMGLVFFTTGCSIESRSPEQLLKEKPIYSKEKESLYKGINQVILNATLELPKNSKDVGQINEEYLDVDGTKEIIAFSKKENQNKGNSEVGFTILSKNNNETYDAKGSQYIHGDSIEYAKFCDLNNDDHKEIIFLSKLGYTYDLHIYSYKNNKISQYIHGDSIEYAKFCDLNNDDHKEIIFLSKLGYTYDLHIYSYKNNKISKLYSLDSAIENLDVKISVSDIDDDKKEDILLITFDSDTKKASISVLDFDKKLNLKGSVEIDDVKNINDLYITIGNVAPKKKGIVLDIPTISVLDFDKKLNLKGSVEIDDVKNINDLYITIGNVAPKKKGIVLDIPTIYNEYKTQIVLFDNGELKKALNDFYTTKSYYIPSQDFNNDKVIEIPIGYITGNNYNKNEASNVSWYRWNGKFDDDSEIVFVSEIYYNYKYNFKFLLPNNIAKKLDVTQDIENKDTLFKFSYYDELKNLKDLFSISVISKKSIDESKVMTTSNGIILNESLDNTFVLYINDIQEMEKLKITEESLKEYFSLIY